MQKNDCVSVPMVPPKNLTSPIKKKERKDTKNESRQGQPSFAVHTFLMLAPVVWDLPHYSSAGNSMYVFPAAISGSSPGTCWGEAFLWHLVWKNSCDSLLHAYISRSVLFIKFTPPVPLIPNEFCPCHRHDDDE